ncbi:hypothetical protein ABH940_005390 [Streptacidiphilus sp. BW17]|uniref:DNA-binding protein n=1 Tax=Streptacidiphilus sp. BW17 TaxID=3156274 RepID=UPI003512A944
MENHRTLLSQLAERLGLTAHEAFEAEFKKKAAELCIRTGDRAYLTELADARRWRRWRNGEVTTIQGLSAAIIVAMFGRTVPELLGPPPSEVPPAQKHLIDESELLMTAHDASDRAGSFASHRVSPIALEQLQDDLTRLARTYGTNPPVTVYLEARRLHSQISTLLDQTSVPAQSQDLHFAAGVVAALLSQVCFDLGSRLAATELARASRMHADVIGHGPLQAFADGTLALLAYWDGAPERAVRVLQRSQDIHLGGAGAVRRASIAARAYAHLGDAVSSRRQLALAAEADRDQRDDLHDGLGGEFAFPEQRRLLSAGSALLSLGDAQGAADSSGQALAVVRAMPAGQRPMKVMGEAAADQALARLLLGDLDAAAESLAVVFEVPAEVRVDGLVQRIRPVREALSRPPFRGTGSARALAERLEYIALESVPALIGEQPALG